MSMGPAGKTHSHMKHQWESNRLPGHLSAQAAERFALTRACILGEGKKVTIYTDNRYAFGVVLDFATLWRMREFLTSTWKQIADASLASNLLESILVPQEIAVCKCEAHTKAQDSVSRGNARVDAAAKAAAQAPIQTTLQMSNISPPITPSVTFTELVEAQQNASTQEPGAETVERLWLHLCR